MTTTFYPDISSYDTGISLDGFSLACVKATQGVGYVNPDYGRVVAEAKRRGLRLIAYHWLDTADATAQARHCFSIVGPSVPVMIDDEQGVINVAHTLAFTQAYRRLGGIVSLEYAPQWVWANSGRPDLRPLAAAGLHIVSSNYTAYSDVGPGWAPYGGVTPLIWQYTDAHPLNGFHVDHNAYRGTVDELWATITGSTGGRDMTPQEFLAITIPGTSTPDHPGDRSVQEILHDAAQRRALDWGQFDPGKVPAGSPLAKLLALASNPPAAGGVSQEALNAAVLAALKDPTVAAGIGGAVAGHIHID